MNSKAIHIDHNSNAQHCAEMTTGPLSVITPIGKKVASFFVRSELARAQGEYHRKQQRLSVHRSRQDILGSLPVEDKLRLGMYRWMN